MNFELFFAELNKFLTKLIDSNFELATLIAYTFADLLVGYLIAR